MKSTTADDAPRGGLTYSSGGQNGPLTNCTTAKDEGAGPLDVKRAACSYSAVSALGSHPCPVCAQFPRYVPPSPTRLLPTSIACTFTDVRRESRLLRTTGPNLQPSPSLNRARPPLLCDFFPPLPHPTTVLSTATYCYRNSIKCCIRSPASIPIFTTPACLYAPSGR